MKYNTFDIKSLPQNRPARGRSRSKPPLQKGRTTENNDSLVSTPDGGGRRRPDANFQPQSPTKGAKQGNKLKKGRSEMVLQQRNR